ncbi:MAG: gliding motility-associated C-terminal domain-containing protein [Fimbriimonadaceae bacterium]|nr:gliding motility-associated C-terminal domain-containing protein [Chitinophagales bacterium]
MKISSAIIFTLYSFTVAAQTLFYEDEFKGGATASGGSPGAYATYTPSDFEIFIPAGSTIRKAYLFAGRHGDAPDTEVDLNGIVYTFEEINQVSEDFTTPYGGNAGVHAIDITADMDPLVSDYTLEVVDSYFGPNNIYLDFYLFITYDNPLLDSTFVTIYLNDQDFDDAPDDPWEITVPQPMDTSCVDIGLTFMTGYACYMSDGEDAYVNDIYIGTWGGNEDNSGDCGGPLGSFTYYDGDLIGLMDDDEDEVVDETDVIATINNYITVGATYLELNFDYVGALYYGESSNAIWAAAIVYGEGFEIADSLLTVSDDATICLGDSINLFADGDGEITWYPTTGLSDPYSFDPIAFPDSTTIYSVTLDQGCLQQTDTIIITVDDFEIVLPDDIILCYGETIEIGIDEEEDVTYVWEPDDYLNNNTLSNPESSPAESIEYVLTATNIHGCIGTDNIAITVFDPEVTASANVFISLGGDANISATTEDGILLWTPNYNIDCDTCFEVIATPEETTTYTVQVTDEHGCTDYDSVTVFVISECEKLVVIPNAFTPNGDGLNDLFKVTQLGENTISGELKVFNRWGEVIFTTTDITRGWDGIYNNNEALNGGYVYYAIIQCSDKTIEKKGVVSLIR